MKLSYNAFLRAYNFFSILFFVFGALAVVVGGPALIVSYAWSEPSIQSAVLIFRLVVVFLFGAGFVISSLVLVMIQRRGFAVYRRIIERFSSERSMSFNLNITFPEQDEFGNLGRWLNKFMQRLREFDRIKVERLRAAQQRITVLSEMVEKGIVTVSTESRITYANSHFIDLFNIGEKTIVGLPINRVIESEEIVKALEEVKEKPRDRVLDEIKIKVGERIYRAKARIVPIISTSVELMESMIIFDSVSRKIIQV
ncbi:MAG: PAS domain-containing protein [Spirochaetota bacterium]